MVVIVRYEGIEPVIFSIDPEFVKEVSVKQFENFQSTMEFDVKDEEMTLDVATGEKWKALRKILSPTFTSGKLKGMLEPIGGIADKAIDHWEDLAKQNPVQDVKKLIEGTNPMIQIHRGG